MTIPDRLLARAEDYSLVTMRDFGIMPRVFLAALPNGKTIVTPLVESEENVCSEFCAIARSLCLGLAATAGGVATVCWSAKFECDKFDPSVPATEALHRCEEVLLFAEDLSGRKAKVLPILRTDAGDFFGFGEAEIPNFEHLRGDVPQIFPQSPPSKAERELARALTVKAGLERFLS